MAVGTPLDTVMVIMEIGTVDLDRVLDMKHQPNQCIMSHHIAFTMRYPITLFTKSILNLSITNDPLLGLYTMNHQDMSIMSHHLDLFIMSRRLDLVIMNHPLDLVIMNPHLDLVIMNHHLDLVIKNHHLHRNLFM